MTRRRPVDVVRRERRSEVRALQAVRSMTAPPAWETVRRCGHCGGARIFESEEQARYALFEITLYRAFTPAARRTDRRETGYRQCRHNPLHFHLACTAPVPARVA